MLFVGSIAALMGNLIAKKVIMFVGELNIIFFGILIECSRLVLWAVIRYAIRLLSIKCPLGYISNGCET